MSNESQKHAYLIMAHNNVNQLNNLLLMLDDERNDVYLHIDAKSSIKDDELFSLQHGNLILIERQEIYWADYSQVECELNLLKEATNSYHAYYHLLSGSDLPLKPQNQIHEYFADCNSLFLHFTTEEKTKETYAYVKFYHVFQRKLCEANRGKIFSIYKVFNKALLIGQKCLKINRIPDKSAVKKGANWFSIPHDFAEFVVVREAEIKKQFQMTRSPDEFFMQTIAFNSTFKDRIFRFLEDDNYASCLRLIDWNRGNPYVYRTQDYEELKNSDMLFARKFDTHIDNEIIMDWSKYIMDRSMEDE